MDKVEKMVLNQLKKLNSNFREITFLLAISGGSDSTCLSVIFKNLNLQFSTAHCNFQLRGEESNGDEEFVREFIHENDIKGYFIRFKTKELASKNKHSIQEEARELRYDWFKQLRTEQNFDYIVTAHHEDDKIETFFINQIRGSGIKGLTSIPSNKNNIIRPLLVVSKKEISNYLADNKIKYRNDSSNDSLKYSRNYLRHQTIPNLENVHPNAKKGILKTIENLIETEEYLKTKIAEDEAKIVSVFGHGIKIQLNDKPSPFLLYNIVRKYGFNKTNITDLLNTKQKGKIVENIKFRMLIDNNSILISLLAQKETQEYIIKEQGITSSPIYLEISNGKGEVNFQNNIAYFDAKKVGFPFILRKWKEGDKFVPLGMKGSKKVSDYFIDKKLNQLEKENCWILESNNKICWIVGYRQDERSKIKKDTINYLKIVTK